MLDYLQNQIFVENFLTTWYTCNFHLRLGIARKNRVNIEGLEIR
jgi:hypothetical protein